MMTETLNAATAERTRILALLPELDVRYARLHGLLDQAAMGADIPEWDLDLRRADVETLLDIIAPAAEALAD